MSQATEHFEKILDEYYATQEPDFEKIFEARMASIC